MSQHKMEDRIVRYGELIPCKTAFIDAHTPGSDQKENFTIIGGGVSESPDQHVHIAIPHGFNKAPPGNLQSAETPCMITILLRYFSFYLVGGDFFGGDGAMQEKWCLSKVT